MAGWPRVNSTGLDIGLGLTILRSAPNNGGPRCPSVYSEPSPDARGDLAAQAARLKKEMDTLARRAANPGIPEEAATQLFCAISERKVQL